MKFWARIRKLGLLCVVVVASLDSARAQSLDELIQFAQQLRTDQAAGEHILVTEPKTRWLIHQAGLHPIPDQVQIARTLFAPPSLRVRWENQWPDSDTFLPGAWLRRLTAIDPVFRRWCEERATQEDPVLPAQFSEQQSIWLTLASFLQYREHPLFSSAILDQLVLDFMQRSSTELSLWNRSESIPTARLPVPTTNALAHARQPGSNNYEWVVATAQGAQRVATELRRAQRSGLVAQHIQQHLHWSPAVASALEYALPRYTGSLFETWLRYWYEHETDATKRLELLQRFVLRRDLAQPEWIAACLVTRAGRLSAPEQVLFATVLSHFTHDESVELGRFLSTRAAKLQALELGCGIDCLPALISGGATASEDWNIQPWLNGWRNGFVSSEQLEARFAPEDAAIATKYEAELTRWRNNLTLGRSNRAAAAWRQWSDSDARTAFMEIFARPQALPSLSVAHFVAMADFVDGGYAESGTQWLRQSGQPASATANRSERIPPARLIQLQERARQDVLRELAQIRLPPTPENLNWRVQMRWMRLQFMEDEAPTETASLNLRDRLTQRWRELLRQWMRIPGFTLQVKPTAGDDFSWRPLLHTDVTAVTPTEEAGVISLGSAKMHISVAYSRFQEPWEMLFHPVSLQTRMIHDYAETYFDRWQENWALSYLLTSMPQTPMWHRTLKIAEIHFMFLARYRQEGAYPNQDLAKMLLLERWGADRLRTELAGLPVATFRIAGSNSAQASAPSGLTRTGGRASPQNALVLTPPEPIPANAPTAGTALRSAATPAIQDLRQVTPLVRFSTNRNGVEYLLHSPTDGAELVPTAAWTHTRPFRSRLPWPRVRIRSEGARLEANGSFLSVPRPLIRGKWATLDEVRLFDSYERRLVLGTDFVWVDLQATETKSPRALIWFLRPVPEGVKMEAYFHTRRMRVQTLPTFEPRYLAEQSALIRETGLSQLTSAVAEASTLPHPTSHDLFTRTRRAGAYLQFFGERALAAPPPLPPNHPYFLAAQLQTPDGAFCGQCLLANLTGLTIVQRSRLRGWGYAAVLGEVVKERQVGAVRHVFILFWRLNPQTREPEIVWEDMTPDIPSDVTAIETRPPETFLQHQLRGIADATSVLSDPMRMSFAALRTLVSILRSASPVVELEATRMRQRQETQALELPPLQLAPFFEVRERLSQEVRQFFHSERRPFVLSDERITLYRAESERALFFMGLLSDLARDPETWGSIAPRIQADVRFRGVFTRWPNSPDDFRRQILVWARRMHMDPQRGSLSPALEDAWAELVSTLQTQCAAQQVHAAEQAIRVF